jgi:hypothetical protein
MGETGHKSLLVFCALPIDWFKVRVTHGVRPEIRVVAFKIPAIII